MRNGNKRNGRLLRARERIGKYRIERCLSDGEFAAVYAAYDTIEGVRVALKIPHVHMMDDHFLEDFRREVRLAARLDHQHVLGIKNAGFIGDRFVIACPLGEETLGARMTRRLSMNTALDLAEQSIEAVAHAHERQIVHCDIKPDNLILFPEQHLRLTDFGIAKMALRTLDASGSGTLGYMAPEQAMGKPSYQSDVFALGLIIYQLVSGFVPEWPFDWPPPGFDRLRARTHPDLIAVIRRALEIKPSRRYRNAVEMLAAFDRVKNKAVTFAATRGRTRKTKKTARDWRQVRYHQFKRAFGRSLETRHECKKCGGPVSEYMRCCPWCGKSRKKHPDDTVFPAHCPRCNRGVKLDWKYCPWCYGAGFKTFSNRNYSDKRYTASCANPACKRKHLMPFMKYCPSCRRAVTRKWKIEGSRDKCNSCGWGTVPAFWSFCPWCSKRIASH